MLLLLLYTSPEAPPVEYDFVEFEDVTVAFATLSGAGLDAATLASVSLEPD